jgi:eukaryotic-like serine/threonine-protein kinase
MTAEQFRRLESLYDAAAGLPAGERRRYIDEACADDEDVRRELLAAFRDEGSGLTAVVESAAAAAMERDPGAVVGRRMGPYQIVRPLGQGGMGAVYLAVRDDDQFHKEVAIKTLKFELGSGPAVARFRHERQILAHLEHPNIARLLDGGATERGTPYIVLEYVRGVQIVEWCQRQRLSIEQRLRLFRQVCDAVTYAHQHLIVHRDLKPGNILVTADGVPKLLDFGIAKLLDAGALPGFDDAGAMATSALLMTPDYVSPEQVRGEPVSTATDVYSLGAVLYELLTGERAHVLQNYDAVEIARMVCDTEIRPPSEAGNHRLRGDLDTIVLKAMQKEPARRYASVVELSEDVRRHLEGLPVRARRDTTVYRATKFARRHRVGVIATAAVVLSAAVGMAASIREARVADRRFAEVRALANTFLFQFYDQVTPLPGSTAVRASIIETARKYLDGLSKEAERDQELILELAQAYERLGNVQGRTGSANLGQLAEARRSYQDAIDLYARLPVTAASSPDRRRRLANVLMAFGRLEYNAYREDVAETFTRRMLALVPDDPADLATRKLRALGLRSLGDIRLRQGQTGEALASHESARRMLIDLQSLHYPDPNLQEEIAISRERLARARAYAGDLDGAASDFQELLRDTPPCAEENPSSAACRALAVRLVWTGDVYAAVDRPNLHDPAKAAALYEGAVHIRERAAALDDHDRQVRFDLAASYGKLGDAVWESNPKRALDLYDRSLRTARTLASKEQLEILMDSYRQAISRPLTRLGRYAEARTALAESLELASMDPNAQQYENRLSEQFVRLMWCRLLIAEGKYGEGRRTLDQIIGELARLHDGHPDSLESIGDLSDAYRLLASVTTGTERREALLKSAAVWHSWPATSFTMREEQKDRAAANQ